MGGQTDRFGQPIPANPGYKIILNPDGTQPTMRNFLRLGAGITATDDPDSEATLLNVDVSIGGAVVAVDAVTNLRNDLFLLGPDANKVYLTKFYYTSTDVGGMYYRWNPSDTATDDGVLYIKNQHHSTGRFNPIRPSNGYINAQACGPALADVGSITRSFDPTGARAMRSEFYRITKLLRNAGWAGIEFSQDQAGNGTYKAFGDELIAPSTASFVPFHIKAIGAVTIFLDPTQGDIYDQPISIYAEGEGAGLYGPSYGPRNWTQTINGGEHVFPNVTDITGLSVGDWVTCRIGASATDFSGWWDTWFIGQIKAITPGSGTTGTVETYQSCPEPTVPAPDNPLRVPSRHDMIKMTGFQDSTVITGFSLDRIFFAPGFYRDLTIDQCHWTKTHAFCINGQCGIGMNVPRIYVSQVIGGGVPGNLITLVTQYDTHIGSMIVNDIRPLAGGSTQVLTEEADCRGTRIDFIDVTYNANDSFGGFISLVGQTENATDLITVGSAIVRGCYQSIHIDDAVHFGTIDIRGGSNMNFLGRVDNVGSIIFQGRLYQNFRTEEFILPIGPSGTFTVNLPTHGITRSLRVYSTSTTGITSALISGSNFSFSFDVTTELLNAGWADIADAALLGVNRPNFPGYNAMSLRIATDGTTAVGSYLAIEHSCFEIDLATKGVTQADTSIPKTIVTNGAPTANSSFIGQECFDSTNKVWYASVSVGSGASDWVVAGSNQVQPYKKANLINGDATVNVTVATYYNLPAGILTGLHTLTLADTGATDKQLIQVNVGVQGSNYLINDSGGTLLLAVITGTKVLATFAWDTGTGKFKLSQWGYLA